MSSQRAFVWTNSYYCSAQLRVLVQRSRWAALCCALVGALVCPQQAVAADYSTPDYYLSANVTPYLATTAVTVVYSASNLSDVPAPATTVSFSMALASDSSQTWDLGQADVPAIAPWQYDTQTVTLPLPAGSPVGTTDMQLSATINPTGGNGEVQTDNNLATSVFEIQTADSSAPSDSSATSTTPAASFPSSNSTTPTASTGGTALTDTNSYPVLTLPRPPLHVPMTDPTFGSTLTRVTEPSMAPAGSSSSPLGLIHEYARFPVLNANNTQVVLQVLGGTDAGVYEVRDLASGASLYKLGTQGDPELSWHPTDPTRLFYRYANEIRVFHTDTGQAETLMSFPQYYTIGTNEEGRPSDDWRYYAFLGYPDSSLSTADLVVVDLGTKQVLATWANTGVPDWAGMSPSGNHVVVMWTDGQGTRLYDRDTLSYVRTLFSDYAHSDFAFDADGNEVLVYQATETKQIDELSCPNPPSGSPIASVRLVDGQQKILLGDCNNANWTPVITGAFVGWQWFTPHFSGIASRQHSGWILISTYSAPETAQNPFAREVFWLKLDGSGQVRRVAHHHSDQSVDANGNKDYWAEPHATSSWDGSTILFASVWDQPFTEYDLYTVTGQWW